MPTKNILRMLVVLQAALWIGLRVSFLLSARVDFIVFLILYIGLIGAGVGLCLFSKVARPLYMVVNVIAMVSSSLHGPLMRSGPMDLFHSANTLLTGVIFMMVFSSPLKEQYEGRSPAPAPAQQQVNPIVGGKRVLFCSACGTPNDGTKFCPQCGKSFL